MTSPDPPPSVPAVRGRTLEAQPGPGGRTRGPAAAATESAHPPATGTATASPTATRVPAPVTLVDLLDVHGPEIYRHLRRLSPTPEDAADLHQEVFLRAHRAWPRLPTDANRRAWLHRIAANVAVDAHRRRTVREGRDRAVRADATPGSGRPRGETGGIVPMISPAAGPGSDPVLRAEAAELRSAVGVALAGLPPREAAAVIARVLDGTDYADVTTILGCSEASARQLVSRGLRRLRASLAPYLEESR